MAYIPHAPTALQLLPARLGPQGPISQATFEASPLWQGGAGMPVFHPIHSCLCFPFLYQSRTLSLITKPRIPCLMHLCTCHSFTFLQNLSSRQARVQIGFRGVCLVPLTSQFVQAAISQALNVIHLYNSPTTFFPFFYCPTFPYFAFKGLLKITN